MKLATWRLLEELRRQQGKEFGKIVQKLLALALLEAGAARATDRAIQGIDLELVLDGRRLAVEVKTCESSSFTLSKKDLQGLASRREEGFECYVAVLGGRQTDAWLFLPVPGSDLTIGSPMSITLLQPFADARMASRVETPFATIVDRHALAAAAGGQLALNRVLEADPRYSRA